MGWRLAAPEDQPALVQFILSREWQSVVYSSCLKEGRFTQPLRPVIILRHPAEGAVTESLMLSPWGTVAPVLRTPSSLQSLSAEDFPLELLTSHYPLHSLMGLQRDVCLLESKLTLPRGQSVDYLLLTLTREQFDATPPPPPLPHLTILQATPKDLKKLFPLQVLYEKEEVCLDLDNFSLRACQYNLKKNLSRQVIFWARNGHQVVAKAGTNALGYCTAQLGGIYTRREKRSRGIARRLVYALLCDLFTRLNTVCLFVKTANSPAIALYNRLGFIHSENYRITYFSG